MAPSMASPDTTSKPLDSFAREGLRDAVRDSLFKAGFDIALDILNLLHFFQTLPLAAVTARDQNSEQDLQAAESGRHKPVAPGRRTERRHRTEHHQTGAHHRDDWHGERASRDYRRPVTEQPQGRQHR